MSEEIVTREFTLVSPDGERTEVVTTGNTIPGQGRISELLSEGYTFDPQHDGEQIEVFGIMPGNRQETRGVVDIGELDQLRRWHAHNYNRDIVVTEDDDEIHQALREQEYADERLLRLNRYARNNAFEAFAYGGANALTAGMFAPVARLIGEYDDSPEFGRRISEVTEASPVASFAGVGVSGLGLATVGRRSVQAIANRVAPGVSRSFSRTIAQSLSSRPRTALAVENLAEEIYYTSAISSLQERPTFSGEAIVAGTAFGMMLGLPFVRGSGSTAMRGVSPQTPAQQVVTASRQQADQSRPRPIESPTPISQRPPTTIESVREIFSGNSVERLRQFGQPNVQHNLRFLAQPNAVDNVASEVGDIVDSTISAGQQARAPLRGQQSSRQVFDPAVSAHAAATSADELADGLTTLRSHVDDAVDRVEGVRGTIEGSVLNSTAMSNIANALRALRRDLDPLSGSVDDVVAAHALMQRTRKTISDFIEGLGAQSQAFRQEFGDMLTRHDSDSLFGRYLTPGREGDALFGPEVGSLFNRRRVILSEMAAAEEFFITELGTKAAIQAVRSNKALPSRVIDASKLRRKLDAKDDAVTEEFIDLFEMHFNNMEKHMKELENTGASVSNQSRKTLELLEDFVNLMKTRRLDLEVRRTSQNNTQTFGFASGPTSFLLAGVGGVAMGAGMVGGLGASAMAFPIAAGMFAAASMARPGQAAAFNARLRQSIANAIGSSNSRTASSLSKVKKKLKATSRSGSLGTAGATLRTGRALAAVGFGRMVTGNPEERANEYHEIQTQLRELVANPQLLSDNLALATSGVAELSEEAADAMNQTAVRGLHYLVGHSPPVASDPLFPGRMAAPPSQSAIDDFVTRYEAIHDPTKLLRDFANNTLSQATVETVRNVYPEIFTSYQVAMSELLTEVDPGTLPYQTRMALSTFLGSRTDATLSSGFVMAMQGRSAQTPEQASAQGMERMPARRINISTSFLTEGQSLENMK